MVCEKWVKPTLPVNCQLTLAPLSASINGELSVSCCNLPKTLPDLLHRA